MMSVVTLVLACVAVTCAVTDARSGRIPNTLTLPGIGIVVAAGAVDPLIPLAAMLCAAGYAVAFAMRACGGGDVKLAVVVGGALGAPAPAVAAVVVAAIATLGLLALRRTRAIVHGPALVGAALLVAGAASLPGG